jgi:hypothetical protein
MTRDILNQRSDKCAQAKGYDSTVGCGTLGAASVEVCAAYGQSRDWKLEDSEKDGSYNLAFKLAACIALHTLGMAVSGEMIGSSTLVTGL